MSIREKVRRVFSRHKPQPSASGIKIEYYRRGEVPPSKFKGPFDKEHQKRLAAWSFEEAQADRPRSLDLSLSPCTTVSDYLKSRELADTALHQARARMPTRDSFPEASPTAYHDEYIQDRQATAGSLSSTTAVDPESFSDSTMTLFLDPLENDSLIKAKEPIRNTSPIIRSVTTSPFPTKRAPMPFAPEDLTRALNAVQVCS
ncbi:hypothetical protein BDW62DRAFT_187235 [Aspergillus aurantiobrunneus]